MVARVGNVFPGRPVEHRGNVGTRVVAFRTARIGNVARMAAVVRVVTAEKKRAASLTDSVSPFRDVHLRVAIRNVVVTVAADSVECVNQGRVANPTCVLERARARRIVRASPVARMGAAASVFPAVLTCPESTANLTEPAAT